MHDLIVRNGTVFDDTGAPPVRADPNGTASAGRRVVVTLRM